MQRPKLEVLGIRPFFDVIVYAGHDTSYKPDPEPFLTALEELDIDAADMIYVGDDFDADVKSAHDVGMKTVWLSSDSPPSQPHPPTAQIRSMDELLRLPYFDRVV